MDTELGTIITDINMENMDMEINPTIDADTGTIFGEKYDIDIKKLEFRREWKKDRAESAALKTITKEERSEIRDFLNREGISEEERRENLALLKTIIDGFSELYMDWLTDEQLNEQIELLDMLEDDVMSDKLSPFDWDPDLWERRGDVDALPFHPAANLLPRMSRDELEQLTTDIATNGLRVPITIYEGQILDGRSRYEACMLAGVQPRFEEYEGQNPFEFVLSANIKRRHLSESQRAMIAAEMANMSHGGNRRAQAANMPLGITQKQAAAWCTISERLLRDARSIIEQDSGLAEQVKRGDMTVNNAVNHIKKAEKVRSGAAAVQRPDASSGEDPAAACNGVDTPDELSAILSDLTQLGISEERLTGEYVRDLRRLLERLCDIKGWAL